MRKFFASYVVQFTKSHMPMFASVELEVASDVLMTMDRLRDMEETMQREFSKKLPHLAQLMKGVTILNFQRLEE